MLMEVRLPKFGIYHGTVAPACFKSHANSLWSAFFLLDVPTFRLMSGLKFTLSRVAFFLPDNLSGLKQNYL